MAILCCVSWVSSGSSLQGRLSSPYPVSQEAVLFSALSSDQKHFPHNFPVTQKSVPQLCTAVPICLFRSLIKPTLQCPLLSLMSLFSFFAGSHCLWMQNKKPDFPSVLAAALWFSVPAVRAALCSHSACVCHFFSNGLGMGSGLFQAPPVLLPGLQVLCPELHIPAQHWLFSACANPCIWQWKWSCWWGTVKLMPKIPGPPGFQASLLIRKVSPETPRGAPLRGLQAI